MIKKVICIILCVIVAFTATACASNGGTEESPDDVLIEQINPDVDLAESPDIALMEPYNENLIYIPYFSDDSYSLFKTEVEIESNEDWYKNGKELNGEFSKQVNELLIDECSFINEKWKKDWQCRSVKVYSLNVREVTQNEYAEYYAFYDLNHGTIFIDESFIGDLKGKLRYVVAHELIHYLYEINSQDNKERFAFPTGTENYYIGGELDEGFTDSIARKYMISRFPKIDRNIFQTAYMESRLNVDLMAMVVPEIYSYYLDRDVEGMKKAIDDYVGDKVYCQGSACKKWASMMDEIYFHFYEVGVDRMQILFYFYANVFPEAKRDSIVIRTREDSMEYAQLAQNIITNQ